MKKLLVLIAILACLAVGCKKPGPEDQKQMEKNLGIAGCIADNCTSFALPVCKQSLELKEELDKTDDPEKRKEYQAAKDKCSKEREACIERCRQAHQ